MSNIIEFVENYYPTDNNIGVCYYYDSTGKFRIFYYGIKLIHEYYCQYCPDKINFKEFRTIINQTYHYNDNNNIIYHGNCDGFDNRVSIDDKLYTGLSYVIEKPPKIGFTTIFLKDIRDHLLNIISQYDYAVGCMYLFTDEEIADIFKDYKEFKIVLCGSQISTFGTCKNIFTDAPIDDKSRREILKYPTPPSIDSSYCRPIMHNKFIVFRKEVLDNKGNVIIMNDAVWTGSYNFTKNASKSMENAVLIENTEIADLYYEEWVKISAIARGN